MSYRSSNQGVDNHYNVRDIAHIIWYSSMKLGAELKNYAQLTVVGSAATPRLAHIVGRPRKRTRVMHVPKACLS